MPETVMKKVEITWIDSMGVTPNWEQKDNLEPLEPSIVISVGFLINDTVDYKTIVQSESPCQVLSRLTIPTCSITKMCELKVGKNVKVN